MSKLKKYEYKDRNKQDGFKKMKDPSSKRRDRKRMKDYEVNYNESW